jgi:hypothetical protein
MIERIKEVQRQTDEAFHPYYTYLPALINSRGYTCGVEIGVFAGGHAKNILENSNLGVLIGIDPYLAYDQIGGCKTQEEFDIMCQLAVQRLDPERFILIREKSDKALKEMKKYIDKIDFIFIDGLHTANQIQKDFDNYAPLVKKGGVIAFHDIDHPMFPELTPVMEKFAEKHNATINRGIMHFAFIEKI